MTEIYILYCVAFLFSTVMGMLIIPRIISISHEKRLMDDPNHRDVHISPTPRLGGIAFVPIILMTVFGFNCLCAKYSDINIMGYDSNTLMQIQAYGIGIMMLYLVGVADDLVSVNFKAKFASQIAAGALLTATGLWLKNDMSLLGINGIPAWIGIPISIFLVVYITNAINLIDGVDGLASGICILTFAFYAIIFSIQEMHLFVCISLAILGVLCVFFIFNVFGGEGRSLKKLFMGDTGSQTLGYTISFLILILSQYAGQRVFVVTGAMYAALAPLVIPLLDIIRVVFARYRDRVPLFQPDRRHIHHKLLRAGLSARMTMVTLLLLTVGFIGLNVVLPIFFRSTWVVAGNAIAWTVMHLVINHFIKKNETEHPEVRERYANPKGTIKNDKWKL